MPIEPVNEDRVVPIAQLSPGDLVRCTMREHAIFGRPLEPEEQNQLTGLVNRVWPDRHASGNRWGFHLELPGLATALALGEAWTVELLDRTRKAVA